MAAACPLPEVFCRPGAIRAAGGPHKLLAWYRGMAASSGTSGKVARAVVEGSREYTPQVNAMGADSARDAIEAGLVQLTNFRKHLDRLKPAINKRALDGSLIISAADWNRYNQQWYGWMGAVAQGIEPRSGATVGGLHFAPGYTYRGYENFGAPPIVIGGVVVGVVAVAAFIYLTAKEIRRAAAEISAALQKCAEAGTDCMPTVKVQPLGGAGGAIFALAAVGGILYAAFQVKKQRS